MRPSVLLALDGVGNIVLGAPLLLFPSSVSRFLGLPPAGGAFYPVVLGSVLVGIGMALLVERFRPGVGGLGLGGAVSINVVFGIALAAWLLIERPTLPLRGALLLWALVAVLVGISLAEAVSLRRRPGGRTPATHRQA
jgi:hypothetical protein